MKYTNSLQFNNKMKCINNLQFNSTKRYINSLQFNNNTNKTNLIISKRPTVTTKDLIQQSCIKTCLMRKSKRRLFDLFIHSIDNLA